MSGHNHHSSGPHEHGALEHHHTVWGEFLCHFPNAIFSVAFSMICLSLLTLMPNTADYIKATYRLFHNFHFLHILFAATGTMLTFRRYSKNLVLGVIVGFAVPALFCTVSDAFLPYLGGQMVGLKMHFHWCFLSHLDTVFPFLAIGVLNGLVMSSHASNLQLFYSLAFHFFHIFISSMASILYLVSFGFHNWWSHMGFVFVFLIAAVLLPCTLSDIVVPMLFARIKKSDHH
jgi:hypothetical protein